MGGREELRYKELVESLNDAVYTVNIQTLKFTSVNHAAEKLTGYTKEELLTMTVAQVIAPEFHQLVKQMIALKRKKGESTIYEIEVINKNERRIPIEISSVAISEKGVSVEILGVARDITERKMAERQRNVFISLITHEIKNPLTSVLMYLGILQKRLKNDASSLTYVGNISQQMLAMNQLMTDLLDVTQMRVGKFRVTKEPCDFNEVIAQAVKPFQVSRTINVTGNVAKPVKADKTRIGQVLVNLLSNAVKYSPKNKNIDITIQQDKRTITVGVQDFGQGITKSEQRHIFDPFYRINKSAKSRIKGHGLGLYICHEIIKQHKGKLWVESKKGESLPAGRQGSTFFFTLPVTK